jgi:hypothetical protein
VYFRQPELFPEFVFANPHCFGLSDNSYNHSGIWGG